MVDEPDATISTWIRTTRPAWCDDTILNWHDRLPRAGIDDAKNFVTKLVAGQGDIDVRDIVGQRDHYAGQTWFQAIAHPQYLEPKMKINLAAYDRDPTYYFNGAEKDISLNTVDGKTWYSDLSGNHRTIIAKFAYERAYLETGRRDMLRNVRLNRYTVDWETYGHYRDLMECVTRAGLRIDVVIESIELHSDFAGGISRKWSEPLIYVGDYRRSDLVPGAHLTSADFRRFVSWVLKSDGRFTRADTAAHWWRWLSGYDHRTLLYPGATPYTMTSNADWASRLREAWRREHCARISASPDDSPNGCRSPHP